MQSTLGSTPAQWPLPDDPVVNTWSILGLARWMAADPTGAGVAFDQAAHRAARLDFPRGPFCRAYILLIRLLVYELSGQTDEALAAVNEMNAIAGRHGFALFHVCAALHAAVVAALRDPASGKGALEGAFEQFRSLGMDLWNPWGFTVLAEISLRADDVPGALRCTAQARQEAERTGAHFWAAETCRVRGLARLANGDPDGRDDLVAAAQLAACQKAPAVRAASKPGFDPKRRGPKGGPRRHAGQLEVGRRPARTRGGQTAARDRARA